VAWPVARPAAWCRSRVRSAGRAARPRARSWANRRARAEAAPRAGREPSPPRRGPRGAPRGALSFPFPFRTRSLGTATKFASALLRVSRRTGAPPWNPRAARLGVVTRFVSPCPRSGRPGARAGAMSHAGRVWSTWIDVGSVATGFGAKLGLSERSPKRGRNRFRVTRGKPAPGPVSRTAAGARGEGRHVSRPALLSSPARTARNVIRIPDPRCHARDGLLFLQFSCTAVPNVPVCRPRQEG
jgi:hypothetical protein